MTTDSSFTTYIWVSGAYTYDEALAGAAAETLGVVTGHLLTFETADESELVTQWLDANYNFFPSTYATWLGISDAATEGEWLYTAGPLTGLTIAFSNWLPFIDPSSGSDYADYNFDDVTGRWSTREAGDLYAIGGYVIEFNGLTSDPGSLPNTLTVLNDFVSAPIDSDDLTPNSISEGAANGTAVGITASSTDLAGDALTYTLTDNAGGRFAIDSATGVVTVANGALIDYETATSHNITVEVSDGELTSTQSFMITVNNVAPSPPSYTTYIWVSGAYAYDEALAGAAAETLDGVTGHLLTFETADESELVTQWLDANYNFFPSTYATWLGISDTVTEGEWLYTAGPLAGSPITFTNWLPFIDPSAGSDYADYNFDDVTGRWSTREAGDLYAVGGYVIEFNGLTSDPGSLPNALTVLSLSMDGNPNSNSVAENAANGTTVGITASATDLNGGAVTYALTDNAGGRFAIDSATGVVTVANGALIDYETATSHNITVEASDGELASSQSFMIAITNALGVSINGTKKGDLIDATHTVIGQSLPTNEEDTIDGGKGNDTIFALGGNDIIDGGPGCDKMVGGAGNDRYTVDNTSDTVLESLNNGTDTVLSSVTYTLPTSVENLTLTGNSNIKGTGNSDNNVIVGNGGSNILAGVGGLDILTGDGGADKFVYTAIGDSTPISSDIITDFVHGTDRINLSAIDARSSIGGNQAFAYGGQNAAVIANSVTWFESGGNTVVRADTNGNATADLQIVLIGTSLGLTAGDLIL